MSLPLVRVCASQSSPKTVPIMAKPASKFDKLAFTASEVPEAQSALKRLTQRYGTVPAETADAIVALGGDGFMLETLHKHMNDAIPIFGINRGRSASS